MLFIEVEYSCYWSALVLLHPSCPQREGMYQVLRQQDVQELRPNARGSDCTGCGRALLEQKTSSHHHKNRITIMLSLLHKAYVLVSVIALSKRPRKERSGKCSRIASVPVSESDALVLCCIVLRIFCASLGM